MVGTAHHRAAVIGVAPLGSSTCMRPGLLVWWVQRVLIVKDFAACAAPPTHTHGVAALLGHQHAAQPTPAPLPLCHAPRPAAHRRPAAPRAAQLRASRCAPPAPHLQLQHRWRPPGWAPPGSSWPHGFGGCGLHVGHPRGRGEGSVCSCSCGGGIPQRGVPPGASWPHGFCGCGLRCVEARLQGGLLLVVEMNTAR